MQQKCHQDAPVSEINASEIKNIALPRKVIGRTERLQERGQPRQFALTISAGDVFDGEVIFLTQNHHV